MQSLDPKLKRYNKKLPYSYSFGIYPTIDLLRSHPELVMKVLLKEEGLSSDGISEIQDICKKNGIKVEINGKSIDKIAYKENTYALAIFSKYENILEKEADHVMLHHPRNLGNIGTVIRTMVAFGLRDLALVRPAGDVFDPKVVRSSMGGLFQIRFKYFDDLNDYIELYPAQHFYPFMLEGGKDIRNIAIQRPYSLIFGNEGAGLDSTFVQRGTPVFIPQTPDVDSLNLSVAAGVAMWEFAQISGRLPRG